MNAPSAPAKKAKSAEHYYSDLSNEAFLARFAKPGCIGLTGGRTIIDKAITRAQKRLHADHSHAAWAHAFVFQGTRWDGRHWVIESDIDLHRKHLRMGVQENPIDKYHDEVHFESLAVLDFGLDEAQTKKVLAQGLEMVATRATYSLRELVGMYMALKKPSKRDGKENVLSKDRSVFCSAFVQTLFHPVGITFVEGVSAKLTTPEDIALSTVPHTTHILRRDLG
jgi:hypothetical protein